MKPSRIEIILADGTSPVRRAFARAAATLRTIRGRILVAFTVMTLITGALAGYAIMGVQDAGVLVRKTYDESLMSINYARAAAADFASMRAAFARRWIADDAQMRVQLDLKIAKLAETLKEDLDVAVQRSQSRRARDAASRVEDAVHTWRSTSLHLLDATRLDSSWEKLDSYAAQVNDQIDLLINYTAGDGFIYRQSALATVERDIRLNIAGAVLALVLSGLVAWALARRIIRPVAAASSVAECIATGRLDVVIPPGGPDELGDLLSSMRLMRDNIKEMMDREVALRRSAQTRLADALENSDEGVVVVDAQDRIALANAQAAGFMSLSPEQLEPGTPIAELKMALRDPILADCILSRPNGEVAAPDWQLADGRWLRVSRSATRDGGFIVVCSDITQSKRQEATLRQSNLRLDAALDNMSQGLCLFDAENRLEVVNRRFFEIFGLSRDRVVPGISFREILELSAARRNHDGTTASQVLSDQAEVISRQKSGTHYYELSDGRIIASVYSPTSNGGWVATFEDVTERRLAEAQIMHMARHDALTDLPNRVLFRERMEQALDRGDKLAVLFVDLDRFKTVNDTLGHPVGDALLCAVTKRLQDAVRGSDIVARLGGDEFAIVQSGARPTDASELAARIIETVSQPCDVLGHQVVIGASVGIAMAPTDGREPDQLLRNADMALYRAKSSGRGSYHFFQPEMDAQMQERHALEVDLRKAIAHGEFEVYYQPIIEVARREIRGFEALVRWNHPQRGLISPGVFIPVAEEIGLIGALGDWVLRQACRDAVAWHEDITVAVNLSAVQFRNPSLPLSIVSALAAADLPARRLELEITETVLLQDDRAVIDLLHQIRALGVRISMDDFGTGYSSLGYLRSFPFDKIKIDRSFVHELGKKDDCLAIVRAVTQLGSDIGMVTIAEGVETDEQLDILRVEGCNHAQGYLFSPPRPIGEIPALLEAFKTRAAA
jgi:diguanylate cyclase (GGDEF)-like protein/PAS domain S-box-containing protein